MILYRITINIADDRTQTDGLVDGRSRSTRQGITDLVDATDGLTVLTVGCTPLVTVPEPAVYQKIEDE